MAKKDRCRPGPLDNKEMTNERAKNEEARKTLKKEKEKKEKKRKRANRNDHEGKEQDMNHRRQHSPHLNLPQRGHPRFLLLNHLGRSPEDGSEGGTSERHLEKFAWW